MVAPWKILHHLQEEKVCLPGLGQVFQGYKIYEFYSQIEPMGVYKSHPWARNGILFSQVVLERQSRIVLENEFPHLEQVPPRPHESHSCQWSPREWSHHDDSRRRSRIHSRSRLWRPANDALSFLWSGCQEGKAKKLTTYCTVQYGSR